MMDVLCIGHAAYDILFPMDGFPAENSKCKVTDVEESGGGPAANAATLLASWGVPAGFAGVIGTDAYGDMTAAELEASGIDLRFLERRAEYPTPLSCILVNEQTGSRTIINRRQAHEPCRLHEASETKIAPKVLLFDSHECEASQQAMTYWPEAVSILDAGTLRDSALTLGREVDYLIVSTDFAMQYSGVSELGRDNWLDVLHSLCELNSNFVAITLGENGVVCLDGDELVHIPGEPVSAIDSTAAGDVFHGAFAYALLQKMTDIEALRFANHVAAISTTRSGSRASIPPLSAI